MPDHLRLLKKQRLTATYAFDHRIVCQKAFCFLHGIGEFTLRALRKHIVDAGPGFPRAWFKGSQKPIMRTHLKLSLEQWNLSGIMLLSLASLSQLLLVVGLIKPQLTYQPIRITRLFIKNTEMPP